MEGSPQIQPETLLAEHAELKRKHSELLQVLRTVCGKCEPLRQCITSLQEENQLLRQQLQAQGQNPNCPEESLVYANRTTQENIPRTKRQRTESQNPVQIVDDTIGANAMHPSLMQLQRVAGIAAMIDPTTCLPPQFVGYPKKLPRLEPGQKMVMGQVLSATAYTHYCRAQQGLQVLELDVDCESIAAELSPVIVSNFKAYVKRLCGLDQLVFDTVPGDLAVDPGVEHFVIPPSDSRPGLSGHQGARAARLLRAGTIVGPYRGLMMFKSEYEALKRNPPREWPLSVWQWAECLESYVVDILGREESQGRFDLEVCCSAYMYGNLTALVNDPRTNAYEQEQIYDSDGRWAAIANVKVMEACVGRWRFPFCITIKDIQPGEELLYDYGTHYWVALRMYKDLRTWTQRLVQDMVCVMKLLGTFP